jgi:EAL domain-containing protein (putative c-di-GMP-specific phosphodiesterase class I)
MTGAPFLYYRPEMNTGLADLLALEYRLRGALTRNEFQLYYQPQIDHATRSIVGVEALLRWNDADRGIVSPAAFIPVLESSGLIVPVGEWVIRQVTADCRRWRRLGLPRIRIAFNVSTLELSTNDFATRFLEIAALNSLEPCDLDIEITEGVLLEDPDFITHTLQRLRSKGVRVAIDDFGTGYSSLSRLSQLPVDILKVDRSFTGRLNQDRTSQAVVSTIIALARTYDLRTVAEGVETPEQLRILEALGCEQSQGHLHSAPVPAKELLGLLSGNHGPKNGLGHE